MPRGRKKATEEPKKPVKPKKTVKAKRIAAEPTVKPTVKPEVVSSNIYYMIESLSGVQAWVYRTDGLYVVRRDQEEPFKTFMCNAGLIPINLKIRTSMNFIDAIAKYSDQSRAV